MMESGRRPIEQNPGAYTSDTFMPVSGHKEPQFEITAPESGDDVPSPVEKEPPTGSSSEQAPKVPVETTKPAEQPSTKGGGRPPYVSSQDSRQFGPGELFLAGRLQVDAAIDALAMTGANPQAEKMLSTVRNLHELATTPGAKDDLIIHLQGDAAAAMKADIAASASLAEQNQSLSPEARIAARGLLDVLGAEE